MRSIRSFLSDDRGAVAMDVVVLTALLVGTTLAVLGTVSGGVETLADIGPHVQLRDEDAEVAHVGALCDGGIAVVQAAEDARAAGTGEAALDVAAYMEATYADLSAPAIREEWRRAQDAVMGVPGWTVARTRLGAVECELVLRGLD